MSLSEKVRLLRVRRGWSQRELAKKVGISYGTISKVETGSQPNVSARVVFGLARELGIDPKDLMNNRVSTSALLAQLEGGGKRKSDSKEVTVLPLESLLQIPVLARVPCGMPAEIPEEMVMGRISLPYEWVRDKQAFAVVAKGDSMTGHGIQTGDYVVVSPNLEVQSGAVALVEVNGEVTIKKVILREDQVVLQPSNHSYEPIFVSEKDEFRIIGKVVFSGRRHE